MVDRQKQYVSYVLSHARRSVPDQVDPTVATAAALGAQDGRAETFRALRSIAEVEAEVRRLEGDPGADVAAMARELQQAREAVEQARRMESVASDVDREVRVILEAGPDETTPAAARRVVAMVPDMGPTARDERELQMARERLQRIIVADGVTETGDRWLHDAAADEIVRLRAEIDRVRNVLSRKGETGMVDTIARHVVAEVADWRERYLEMCRERDAEKARAARAETALFLLREKGGAMARQGAAGERAAQALDGQTGGLSAEDAETPRGARWQTLNGLWQDPSGGIYNPRHDPGLSTLRTMAAHIREKAPTAAHMEPGKATGEESATAGKGSVAEEQGADKDALNAFAASAAAAAKERGIISNDQLHAIVDIHHRRLWPERYGVDHGPHCKPASGALAALPKPKRVEAGQRWRLDGLVSDSMPVLWQSDGMAGLLGNYGEIGALEAEMLTSLRWTFLGPAPTPQGPDGGPEGGEETEALRSEAEMHNEACGAADEPSEPTARDAVAGMLLRRGHFADAQDLASGAVGPAEMAADMRRHVLATPGRDACIAALGALARGDLRGAREASRWEDLCLANKAEAEQVAAERDALLEQHASDIRPGPGDEAMFDAASRLHLVIPKGADAREVLATVAELLGFPTPAEEAQGQIEANAYNHGFREGQRRARAGQPEEAPIAAPDREALGRAVNDVYVEHYGGPCPWEGLGERSREHDRKVGERLFAMGARHGRAEVKALVQRWRDRAMMPAGSHDLTKVVTLLGRAEGLREAAAELEAALAGGPGPEGGERVTGECTSSPASQESAPHAPDGGQPVDSAAQGPTASPGCQRVPEVVDVYVCRCADCDRVGQSVYRTKVQGGAWCEVCGRRLSPMGAMVATPITPPAERYAAPGQDGGDVPASPPACGTCGGSGEVNAMDYTGNTEDCPACDGPADRATHPVASAAPVVPESHAGAPYTFRERDASSNGVEWTDLSVLAHHGLVSVVIEEARCDAEHKAYWVGSADQGLRLGHALVRALAGIEPGKPVWTLPRPGISQSCGADASPKPWRGLTHEARESSDEPGAWYACADLGGSGMEYSARFDGPYAEARAIEYAAWVSAPAGMPCKPVLAIGQERAADNGVWCSAHGGRMVIGPHTIPGVPCASCGKATSTGCCWGCTVAGRCGKAGAEPAKPPADPRGHCPEHGAPDPRDQCTRCVAAQFPREVERRAESAPAKPASVEPWQVWRWIGCDGDITVQDAPDAQGIAVLRAGVSDRFAERAVVMLSSPGWTFLRNAKPAQVLRGQRWRCVGLEAQGELEVERVEQRDAPAASRVYFGGVGRTSARAADMLRLPQWTFVSGPRE